MSKAAKTAKLSVAKKSEESPRPEPAHLTVPKNIMAEVHFLIQENTYRAKIREVSKFGLTVTIENPPLCISTNQFIDNIQVLVGHSTIHRGCCRVAEESNKGNYTQFYLYLCEGPLNLQLLNEAFNNKQSYTAPEKENNEKKKQSVQPEFKTLCADFLHYITDLEQQLSIEEKKIEKTNVPSDVKHNIEDQVLKSYLDKHVEQIRSYFMTINKHVSGFNAEQFHTHKDYFKTLFRPKLFTSSFVKNYMQHTNFHGTDYGHMIMFYEMDCQDIPLFGKFIHRFKSQEPIAHSHQNRTNYISQLLFDRYTKKGNISHSYKISGLASGPSREVSTIVDKLNRSGIEKNLDIILIDKEAETLDHAKKQVLLKANNDQHVICRVIAEDAIQGVLNKEHFTHHIQNSDIILIPGLFEYLSDRVASAMIQDMFKLLRPGGLLLIANSSQERLDHFSMNFMLEGSLFYRDKNDLIKLVSKDTKDAGARVKVLEEPLGLDLFLHVEKK